MAHRDVDLIIRDEGEMKALVRFLIYRLQTIDGQRGSASKLLEHLLNKSEKEYSRKKQTSGKMPKLLRQYKSYLHQVKVFR